MAITYLNSKKWSEITREERLFCFELFEIATKNPKPLLKLIKKEFLKEIEIGVEVCFFRDLVYEFGQKIGNLGLPYKRTFDLTIFSPNEIVIIEAKSNEGFTTNQLEDFKKDKDFIKKMFRVLNLQEIPNISLIGIHSSKYRPSDNTKDYFESLITWEDLSKVYADKSEVFARANNIY